MDPYKVLGVSPDATDEEIKKAYRTLTKKYHPDLNPGNAEAEKKYSEINAAYDAIQKGTATSSSAQGQYSYGGGSQGPSYSWGNWGAWQQQYWQQTEQSDQDYERTEYRAAVNYIRNGMYKEAVNALNQVDTRDRDARWYYLVAYANLYQGNKVAALENAKKACDIEPDNEEYARLLQTIQSGSNYYDKYTVTYNNGIDPSRLCLTFCALQACLGGGTCPLGYVFCC